MRTTENASSFPDFILFKQASECSSGVGMKGGSQAIRLATGCSTGSIIHEIGHAVGLWHEQSREKRDDFIKVLLDNVVPEYRHNFNQHITDGDDIGPYDYCSIMHYPPNAFGKKISRLADSGQAAGDISLVSAVTLAADKVITAVRDGDGDLKLISWTLLP